MFKIELTPPLVAISACLFTGSLFAALPDGYQRLEYIQFNGSQYIELPQAFSSKGMGVQLKVWVDKRDVSWAPHVVNTDTEGVFWVVIRQNSATTGIQLKAGGASKELSAEDSYVNKTGIGVDTIVDFNSDGQNQIVVNNKPVGTFSAGTSVKTSGKFCIGNYYGQRTVASASLYGRYYYCKFYSNGTLMVDLVPCERTSDSAVGFYDVKAGAFYGAANANGPALTAGPVATGIEEELTIAATPRIDPVVSPAYGTVRVKAGESLELSAPLAWTNDTGDCRAELAGWTLYESEDGSEFTAVTNGTENTYTYVNAPAKTRKFEWHWRYYNRYAATATAPLRLDAAEKWIDVGATGGFSVTNVPRGRSVKWEVYAGTVNGLTTGSSVSVVAQASHVFRAVVYEDPIELEDFYLTTSWQPIATGFRSVADVTVLSGKMNGGWITAKDTVVYTYGVTTVGAEKQAQFIMSEGGHQKCLVAAFKVEAGSLYAKAMKADHQSRPEKLGEFVFDPYSASDTAVATSATASGYGVHALVIARRATQGLLFLVR